MTSMNSTNRHGSQQCDNSLNKPVLKNVMTFMSEAMNAYQDEKNKMEQNIQGLETAVGELKTENNLLKETVAKQNVIITDLKSTITKHEVTIAKHEETINRIEFQKIVADNIATFLEKLDNQLMTVPEYANYSRKVFIGKNKKTDMISFFRSKIYTGNKLVNDKINSILTGLKISEPFIWYAIDLKRDRNQTFHTNKKLTTEQIDMYVDNDFKDEFKNILQFI